MLSNVGLFITYCPEETLHTENSGLFPRFPLHLTARRAYITYPFDKNIEEREAVGKLSVWARWPSKAVLRPRKGIVSIRSRPVGYVLAKSPDLVIL